MCTSRTLLMKLRSTIEDLAAKALKLGATKFIATFGNAAKEFYALSNDIKKSQTATLKGSNQKNYK